MTLMINIIWALIIGIMRITITNEYCSIFLACLHRKVNLVISYIIGVLYVIAFIIFDSVYVSIVETFIVTYIIILTYEGELFKKIIFSCINVLIWVMAYVGTLFILVNNIISDNDIFFIKEFLIVFLIYIFTIIVKNTFGVEKENLLTWYGVSFFAFFILSIAVWSVMLKQCIGNLGVMTFVTVALFVINVLGYKMFKYISDSYKLEYENVMLKEQQNIYEKQISDNIINDRIVRGLRHDMKRHIRELQTLVERENYDELKEYIHCMSKDATPLYDMAGTGNVAVDGVLDYMYSKAIQENIKVTKKVAIPEGINLKAYDMNIILGNLFENAIENTLKTDEPAIDFVMRYKAGTLYISVSNNCISDQKLQNGQYVSTKQNKEKQHGYGISNIKRCVDKYNGTMQITCKEERFTAEILMFV